MPVSIDSAYIRFGRNVSSEILHRNGQRMSETRRIANYRSGDRAEALGIVLMQLFAAIAPVPREEDFGIFDAIATLLRRDGKYLYAEDSFLVQFKSRTTTSIEFRGTRFQALLNQESALFIARVDLVAADIKLYSTAHVLSHPNLLDNKGLVLHFDQKPLDAEEQVMHRSLHKPILHWTAGGLEDRVFEEQAYKVMKRWVELDRWNRRYRKLGIQTRISWKTNEIPLTDGTTISGGGDRGEDALAEIVPVIQVIAANLDMDMSLTEPVLKIMEWMRSKGVEADPFGTIRLLADFRAGRERLSNRLEQCSEADIAVEFREFIRTEDSYRFLLQSLTRSDCSSTERIRGSLCELEEKGFVLKPDANIPGVTHLHFEKWAEKLDYEVIQETDGIVLLRRRVRTAESI